MSKLIAVAYRVTSDRIRDTELKAGTTVREFVALLAAHKFDVTQAHVRVIRREEDDVLIGRIGDYVLKEGDAVELITDEVDMPVLKKRIEKMQEAEQGHGVVACDPETSIEAACPCGGCASKIDVTSEKTDKGVVIHITVQRG